MFASTIGICYFAITKELTLVHNPMVFITIWLNLMTLASNPESLADVVFGLSKPLIGLPYENVYTFKPWYRSEVLQNQGNLTWNCTSATTCI